MAAMTRNATTVTPSEPRERLLRPRVLRALGHPVPVDERAAVVRVDDGPFPVAVAFEGALVVVEKKRRAGFVVKPVHLVDSLLLLTEEVEHERLLAGRERFEDERVHLAVARQRNARDAPALHVPRERRRRDAVEVRVADYMKKRSVHRDSSGFLFS